MMPVPAGVKVHLALGYTDLRKGLDGLAVLVERALEVEHEDRRDVGDPPELRLAHRAVLLAPAEDAFDRLAATSKNLVF